MTISTQDSKVNYQGNGQTTVFQIPFPFLENNQIYVQKKDAEGILINYTYATDYTVTGAGEENGGSVTLNVAPEQGSTISIYRDVPLTQEVDYRENEIFPAETHEEALDKLTMEVQQIQEQLDRSVKVDRFSDVDLDIIINEIERVYDSTDNIDITANNINNVNTVADNIANVNTVAGDIDSVVTTATNIKDVNTVAQNKASLNITAANIEDIKTVSSIKGDVHTVAGNNTNVTTVATNISDVNTAASNMAAIQYAPTAAANAAQSAANAANSATISANSAIWAEGTDAQVQALGGVHSSKGWAEQSTSVNIALTNSPYTTNRILEIPQDIKLELNNGTLTLKAGSKAYKADGIVVTVPSDINYYFNGTTADNLILVYDSSLNSLGVYIQGGNAISSATAPSTGVADTLWFDTTSNKCKITHDNAATWTEIPLPIGLVSCNVTDGFTSIDQVFNGFGYIGSTVFVLPGVKCLVGNGRNPDGSCITKIEVITKVSTFTTTLNRQNNKIVLYKGAVGARFNLRFDERENMCCDDNGVNTVYQPAAILGTFSTETTSPWNIKEFNPLGVDSVLNSSLSNLSAAGQAKFDAKANVSNTVTTDTAQTIGSSKRFTAPAAGMSIELVADSNQQTVPTTNTLRQLGLYRNATYTKGDGFTSWLQAYRGSDGWTSTDLYTRKFLEGDSQEIMNYISVRVTPDGIPIAYTKTPPVGVVGEEIVTAGWFNSKMQVVSALPAAPDANVFYFIPG